MPFYLPRFSDTPATWAKLIKNPEDRRSAAKQYIESVGGKLGLTECRGDCVGHAKGLIDHVSAPGRTRIGAEVVGRDTHVGPFRRDLWTAHHGAHPNRSPAGRKIQALMAHQTDSRLEPDHTRHATVRRMPAAATRLDRTGCPGSQPPHHESVYKRRPQISDSELVPEKWTPRSLLF
jgi:hypothetical protein